MTPMNTSLAWVSLGLFNSELVNIWDVPGISP